MSILKAPPVGFYKVNTDAAASDDERNSCIGVVIRICKGEILAAACKVLPACFSAKISEAFVVLEGVLLAVKMEVSHVIIEFDALSIIQAIYDGVFGGELGHIVQNIWDVSSLFSWCSFLHLKGKAAELPMSLQKLLGFLICHRFWKGLFQALLNILLLRNYLCNAFAFSLLYSNFNSMKFTCFL